MVDKNTLEKLFLDSFIKLETPDDYTKRENIFKLFKDNGVFDFLSKLKDKSITVDPSEDIIDVFISPSNRLDEAVLMRVAIGKNLTVDIILIGLASIERWESFPISIPSKDKRRSFEYQLKILEDYISKYTSEVEGI